MISNSRRATYGYDQRIEVHGSKGMVAAENQRPVSIEIANEEGLYPSAAARFLHDPLLGAYAHEIAAFVTAASSKKAPGVGPVREATDAGAEIGDVGQDAAIDIVRPVKAQ